MQKLKFFFLISIVIILSNSSKAIDTISVKYFPLAVGNAFVYNYSISIFPGGTTYLIVKSTITKDTIINNRKYFYSTNSPLANGIWVRTDTITGSLYSYDPTNSCQYYQYEKLIDSLAANVNDTVRNCARLFVCYDTADVALFGFTTKRKGFIINVSKPPFFHSETVKFFIKHFGLSGYYYSSYSLGGGAGVINYVLKGCVINGVVYGDTTTIVTGISNLSNNIPQNFLLFQNYPNPFNPITSIKFDIPKSSFVKLSVYDISGKEIESLVNEILNAGSYEVKWDGNNYSSGVYFYKIETENASTNSGQNFIQTKRMILLK